ncbi:MAG: hypothetical protein JRI22_20490 [Deltaproteobacteria bacterium]|nr:hypothetical protein [Deltaproteobacteria bacterium]
MLRRETIERLMGRTFSRFPSLLRMWARRAKYLEFASSPWLPVEGTTGDLRVALITTAGVHLKTQRPFDMADRRGDPSLSVNSWISIGFGTTSVLGLLAFFLVLNTMSGSLDLAVSAIGQFWTWIFPLAAGFGFQVGLFTYFRRIRKTHFKEKAGGAGGVAASGRASATAMAACCAHYLPALLPLCRSGFSGRCSGAVPRDIFSCGYSQ